MFPEYPLQMRRAQVHRQDHHDHVITTIGGTPFEMSIYRLGNKYLAARRDEYGYANCEIEW